MKCVVNIICSIVLAANTGLSMNAFAINFKANTSYRITDTLNLEGKSLVLPEGVKLYVTQSGLIYNGRIVGNNTKLEGQGVLFDKVQIAGTWNAPKINTSMFANLDYVNSLKQVFALMNSSVHNDVVIGKGKYYVSVFENAEICLRVLSNTSLTLKGDIILKPNNFTNYVIVSVPGQNVTIKGQGSIIGDRKDHLTNQGEWGMCLAISGENVNISNITIRDAWGDCIYVTGHSKDVKIDSCVLDGGRRQGISIISGEGIVISNCNISSIGGTDPEYAIDVEPNKGDTVKIVAISRVKVRNCKGAVSANGRAANSYVGKIKVNRCDFSVAGKPVVIGTTIDTVIVKNCKVIQNDGDKAIAFDHVESLAITNNKVTYVDDVASRVKRIANNIVGKNTWPLIISECQDTIIRNNKGL